jgi:hypothetical protein
LYQNPNSNLIAYFPGKPFEKKLEDGSVVLKYRDLGQGNTYEVEIIPYDASLSFEEMAAIYIASPPNSPYKRKTMDDGTEIFDVVRLAMPDCYEIPGKGFLRVPDLKTSVFLRSQGQTFKCRCKKNDDEFWDVVEKIPDVNVNA